MVDRIFAGLMFVASVLFLYMAWGYTAPIAYDPIGPRPFPVMLLALLALGTLVLVVRPAKFSEKIDLGLSTPVVKNLVLCVISMLLYALFFETLGFVVATALMATAVGLLFGGKLLHTVIASVALAVLGFLLFDKALDVSLPWGVLSFLKG